MIKTLSIEPKEIKHPITQAVQGTAIAVDLTIQYFVGEQTAKGYYEFKDENDSAIEYGRGNMDIPTTDWADDDTLMFSRFAALLGVVVVTI
ncbi:hypothetical protein BDD43_3381 [Mucilaginibacter gracilis]|uniref:Uncharacterized protein n=1 Tax=Mucilaginibacter gracilis TaxID=423350 RepID=A0A495J5C1_9SPHI|nr:hypothetical protein [Mucilaginibacter gracilis]RKR83179.1 hypothetical protein BDD43_3381 [Mucilaginibacter gracilis]